MATVTDFAAALRTRLVSASTSAGTKVYWGIVPQGAAPPYVRLQTISDPRPEHLTGYDGARQTRVQADAFASTYGEARAISARMSRA